jgi:iron complex transport system substrate-binding protein
MNTVESRFRRLLLVAVVAAFLVAPPSAAPASSSPSGFPVAVDAANGVVVIQRRPTRIVSLTPSGTQDLYAVGAGNQVVAVDAFSTYPASAPRTSMSGNTPNAEAIARYHPDLVVVSQDVNSVVSQLGRLHIPVLYEPAAATLDDVYAEIEQIAAATGHRGAAAGVVAGIRRQVSSVERSVPRPRTPITVYTELTQDYYSVTSRTFIGQILALLGLRNIADHVPGSNPYPQLSDEYIVASDPDLIVLADTVCCHQSRATVAARPAWDTISAVRTGAIVPVNDSIISQWGPRILIFMREVADAVIRLERRTG